MPFFAAIFCLINVYAISIFVCIFKMKLRITDEIQKLNYRRTSLLPKSRSCIMNNTLINCTDTKRQNLPNASRACECWLPRTLPSAVTAGPAPGYRGAKT